MTSDLERAVERVTKYFKLRDAGTSLESPYYLLKVYGALPPDGISIRDLHDEDVRLILNALSQREGEVERAASFLLARIDELDWSQSPDEFARDWHGHVEPPIARLRAVLHPGKTP